MVTGTLEISWVAVTPPASVHRRLVFLKTINPRSLSGCWLCSDAARASSGRCLSLGTLALGAWLENDGEGCPLAEIVA